MFFASFFRNQHLLDFKRVLEIKFLVKNFVTKKDERQTKESRHLNSFQLKTVSQASSTDEHFDLSGCLKNAFPRRF